MGFSQGQAGVTMIEVLIVLAIAAILAGIAAPSFDRFINDSRQSSVVAQLTGDLNRARSEAIKRNRRMLVCVRASDTACGTITDWRNGWLVCYDEDQDDACDAGSAANPNPIALRQAIHANLTLTASAAVIRFNPNGTQGSGNAATLTLTGNWNGALNKDVKITATGNISRP